MFFRVTKRFLFLAVIFSTAFLSDSVFAQRPTPNSGGAGRPSAGATALSGADPTIDIDVYVRGADGAPIDVTAVVTLLAPMGQMLSQGTTLGGNIKFSGLAASEYTIQVVAPGYENAVKEFDGYNGGASRVIIEMRPASNGGTGAGSSQILLAPKAQKELGKALEARQQASGSAEPSGCRLSPGSESPCSELSFRRLLLPNEGPGESEIPLDKNAGIRS